MSIQDPIVSVIVPVYNSSATISDCLFALTHQELSKEKYEIIVIDDGSYDNTIEIAKTFIGVRCFQINHGGPSVARNAGVREAKGEIIAFTDSDCIPTPHWLEELLKPFENNEIIGAKGVYKTSQKELISRFVQLEYQYKYKRMKEMKFIDFIDTYSAAYRRDVFLENGGFDSIFTVPSVEDQEFSFRLAQKGYKMVFAPNAEVFHQHDETVFDYIKRKFGIGYWKAYMLRWIPQKTISDTHTSPSQRIQIMLLALTILNLLLGVVNSYFLTFGGISAALFFLSGIRFWKFVGEYDFVVGSLFPFLLLIRGGSLGVGLVWGLISPPKKGQHRTISLPFSGFFLKRVLDIFGSILGLIISAPIIIFAAIAIRYDSPGPVFFSQIRAGENGRPFKMIKLRTMIDGAEEKLDEVIQLNNLKGPVFKIPNDPRVTRVGRFLRRWSIDELPQFWNVLHGEMSLVGPRPEELWIVDLYNDEQRKRLAFKPGLTGPMQINGRGNLDFDDRLRLELEYMNNYSLFKDISIIFKTVIAVFNSVGSF